MRLFICLLCCFGSCFGEILQPSKVPPYFDFIHRVQMDQVGAFVLQWTPLENEVVFEVQVQTGGYVGLGFSSTGKMKGADIVTGWVDGKGVVHFSDRHGTGNKTPSEDSIHDYKLLGGFKNDTHTVLRFSRPWVTCDQEHDFPLTEATVRVLWAYDAITPRSATSTLSYHDHRGVRSLYLKERKMSEIPADAFSWDIRSPNVRIPNDFNTLYWCKLYKAPELTRKHHVIGYEPLVNIGNEAHVHHMLFYECNVRDSEHHLEKWVDEKGAQCYSENMPFSWSACGSPLIAWAIGSQGEAFPEHVGFPIREEQGGATYFLLEIHYDNPELKHNVVDNSGLRIYLTDQLRQYAAGILLVGHKVEPSLVIPPGRVWNIPSHCTADCTKKTLPKEGINAFSVILHAHTIASSINIQHIRNNKELKSLIEDDHYDFNFQQSRNILPERKILPGDHLITNCVFNATGRKRPTFGGFGTEAEMCLGFIAYYPRVELAECISRVDLALLFNVFGIENIYDNDNIMKTFSERFSIENDSPEVAISQLNTMKRLIESGSNSVLYEMADFFRNVEISDPPRLRGKTFYQLLMDKTTWRDAELIGRLKEAATYLQYEPACLNRKRHVIEGLAKKAKYPRFSPYQEANDVCVEGFHRDVLARNTLPPPVDTASLQDIKGVGNIQEGTGSQIQSKRNTEGRSTATLMTINSSFIVCVLWIIYYCVNT